MNRLEVVVDVFRIAILGFAIWMTISNRDIYARAYKTGYDEGIHVCVKAYFGGGP